MNHTTCNECEAIRQELRDAYAEAWISADQATREAWVATYRLIGGTEEDAARAEELIPKAEFRERLRIRKAVEKMFAHVGQSGHKPGSFRDIVRPPER